MSDETNGKANGHDPETETPPGVDEGLTDEERKKAAYERMVAAAAFLHYATTKYPDKISVLPFHVNLEGTVRKNDKHAAMVQLFVPDEMVKNLKGDPEQIDIYFAMRIPRFVLERFNSKVVLPGER